MRTKHNSHCINSITKGCKYCVKGQKLVLFVGGKCSRRCWYCSLSEGRKDSTKAWANERPIKTIKDLIEEVKESNAKGAGITGGDPLVYYKDTIRYAKALKKAFGKHFHIHVYLPFPLVTEGKLKELHKYIDEVRFHATFLVDDDPILYRKEIVKLKVAAKIFGKQNTGIELPAVPAKKKEILQYIKDVEGIIGFANLNELEISDTNFKRITREYKMSADTYTIKKSKRAAMWILKKLRRSKLKIHFCTAKTKNIDQYQSRLKIHKIMPYGHKTDEGTVIYFAIENIKPKTISDIKKLTKQYYVDKKSKRIILNMDIVNKIHQNTDYKIAKVEEHPTFEREIMTREYIGE